VSHGGLSVATAGAIAQSNALDATANNIANASTAGFRGDKVTFREVLRGTKSADVAMVDNGRARVDGQAGTLMQTDNPMDVALEGEGFFEIQTDQGMRYTRAGNFRLDDQSQLVTADGFKVLGTGKTPIALPPGATNIAIGPDGSISADGAAVGKLEIVNLDGNQLRREGGTLFSSSATPRPVDAETKVRAGMLEASNVNVVRGVVDLVKVSRTYESLMRVIQTYSEVESRAARDLGGPK